MSERRREYSKTQREVEQVKSFLAETEAVLSGAKPARAIDANKLSEILGRFIQESECW